MNLEDRLRGHLHSGEDFFDESGPDAGTIAVAGQRRTRRNQLGGAVAAGVVLIGLVVGGTNALRDSTPEEFAVPDPETTEVESSEDSSAATEAIEDDVIAQDADVDDSMSSQMFDGPLPPIEIVVGRSDGFVGLRDTNGTLTAISSTDGVNWEEVDTNLAEGLSVIAIDTDGLTLAATFVLFDGAGEPTNFIGTSVDLASWDVVPVDLGAGGLGSVAVNDGVVVASAMSIPSLPEDSTRFTEPVPMVAAGLAGGPYELVEFGDPGSTVDQLVATEDGFAASVFGETMSLATSPDGRTWDLLPVPGGRADFMTPHVVDGALLVTVFAEQIEIYLLDAGSEWTPLGLPDELIGRTWFSAAAVSNPRVTAWQFYGDVSNALVAMVDGELVAVSTSDAVDPGLDWMLVAVSDDELLLQIFSVPGAETDGAAPAGPTYVRIPLP